MLKHILIIHSNMELGGAESSLLGLLDTVDYSKYTVDLFLLAHTGEFLPLINENVRLLPEEPRYKALLQPISQNFRDGQMEICAARSFAKARSFISHGPLHLPHNYKQYFHKLCMPFLPTPVRPPRPHTPQKTERTDCQRDGCMVGTRCVGVSRWSYLAPGASDGKVLCGHKPQSKPHLSEPGTHQRTWRVMGRPARQKTQTLSMTRRNDRTRHDHAAAPLAVCPFVPPSIHPSHPHKKRAPRPKHPGTLPKLKYPIIINRYQLLPVVTNHHPTRSRNF